MNAVNWFEIPVKDMARAKSFYETVLGKELIDISNPEAQMLAFPWKDEAPAASGALVKAEGYAPNATGTTVYFHSEDVDIPLGKVEANGGRILFPKTSIGENGFIAHALDTEGNRIAFHSEK